MLDRNSYFGNLPPVTKNLLIINFLLWALMAFMPSFGVTMEKYLALYSFSSPGFKPYQLFTYMFLHAGFMHMFFNMFALFMFGRTIEMAMGSKRFLFYYISCGIFAALVQLGIFSIYIHRYEAILDPAAVATVKAQGLQLLQHNLTFADVDMAMLNSFINTPMVGASGAIYGILLAFGFLFPRMPIYFFFIPVPIQAKWLVIGYFVLELLFGLGGAADNVAHFAHVGGMVFGLIMLLYWKKKGTFNNHWFF